MKKFVLFSMLITFSLITMAQVLENSTEEEKPYPQKKDQDEIQTLFSKDKAYGGYFDIYMNYTIIDKKDALEVGSRLALIIGHSFAIGIDGAGFITDISKDANGDESILTGGYGGILLEPIIMAKYPVHVSIPVVLGGGAAIYASTDYNNGIDYLEAENVDGFLMAKPGIEVEFNITRNFRFCLNTHYRLTTIIGPDSDNSFISARDLNNFSYGISFKIGMF